MKRLNIIFFVIVGILVSIILVLTINISKYPKIGCFNSTLVLGSYKEIVEFSKKLESKKKENEEHLETLRKEFEILIKDYESKRKSLNEMELKSIETTIKSKQEEYSKLEYVSMEKFKKEEQEIIQRALNFINTKVHEFAIKNNYSIILASTPNGEIVYANDMVDVTNEIIKYIN